MNAEISGGEVQSVFLALERVTLDKLLGAGFLLLAGLVVIRIAMHALRRLADRLPLEKGVTGFMLSATRIALLLVLGTMVAGKLGVPVTSVVALLSLFALAISLSVQDVLANVVSGMVILIAKPFSAGDYIETASAAGTVETIGLMYTNLLSPDNKVLLVPNRELSSGRITNYSAKAFRRVDASVLVGYEHGSHRVIAALLRAADASCKGMDVEKPPFAAVNAYKDSGIEYVVRAYVPTQAYWPVYHALLLAVRDELEADGIALTYGATRVKMDEKR